MSLMPARDYAYLSARVSARKAKLLEEEDYRKLSRMEPSEIARFLGERSYSEEVKSLGDTYEGADLVERAVAENLSRDLSEVFSMSEGPVRDVLEIYLRKYDIQALKRLLRAKSEEIELDPSRMPVPGRMLGSSELERLAALSYEEMMKEIGFSSSEVDYGASVESMDVKEVETELERAYRKELRLAAKRTDSNVFSRLIRSEIEHSELSKVLRRLRYEESPSEIMESCKERKVRESLTGSSSAGDAIHALREAYEIESEDPVEMEREFEKDRLRKALTLSHAEPLGSAKVLGYVVTKEVEADNLKTIARGKAHGLETEELMEKVILRE